MIDLVGFSVGGLSKCFCHTSWRRRRWERERRHQRRSERESVVRGGTKPTQLERKTYHCDFSHKASQW